MEKIFLLECGAWSWTLTEDECGKQYYDRSLGGLLFSSGCDCPVCGGKKSLSFAWSCVGGPHAEPKDCHCLSCYCSMDVLFTWGEGILLKRDTSDDDFYILPSHVVVLKK
jgi:hypothetical protein